MPVSDWMAGRPIDILLIEDDADDVLLTREMFTDYKVSNRLTAVDNGRDALALLTRTGRYVDAQRPDLILLDLHLPGIDGRDVLEHIRRDEELQDIPVVVLTSSRSETDILRARQLAATAYVIKPVDFAALAAIVRIIDGFGIAAMKAAAGGVRRPVGSRPADGVIGGGRRAATSRWCRPGWRRRPRRRRCTPRRAGRRPDR